MKTFLPILLLFFVSGCASQAKIHHVEIVKFKFIPNDINIQAGDTIIWTNKEKRQYHSVWFKATDLKEPNYIFPGETFTKTFDDKGNFPYECGPHPKMKGSVQVISTNK